MRVRNVKINAAERKEMKTAGVILTIVLMLSGTAASADVVDMRAYSIKRGFKAYHAKKSAGHQPVVHKTTAASPKTGGAQLVAQKPQQQQQQSQNAPAQPPAVSEAKSKQHKEMQKYIDENPEVLPDI